MGERHSTKVGRVLAVLLVLGGAFGVLLAVLLAGQLLAGGLLGILALVAFVVIFAWSGVVGVWLWQGRPAAWTWALALFVLQIPTLAVPGFAYEFYTGLAVKLVGGDVPLPIAIELGSRIALSTGGATDGFIFGINLIAVAAAIYLLRQRVGGRGRGVKIAN